MDINKNNEKLKSYSQASSLNRLSEEDYETTSTLIAGGDEAYISKDINDEIEWFPEDSRG
ncbi:hypothetical protein [Clostridium sp. DJ247]|uniref:hypothetical protein n=1 Tax=Clostridium sp. DJ247 TaxID=2726188 RepID=UPI001626FDEC|nr:hypothetical protein [Clostridium sp. DJ247]MBC2582174.1 hypothetical protein [Clostridium sp. DJ247]